MSPIGRLPRWRIEECLSDMDGTEGGPKPAHPQRLIQYERLQSTSDPKWAAENELANPSDISMSKPLPYKESRMFQGTTGKLPRSTISYLQTGLSQEF